MGFERERLLAIPFSKIGRWWDAHNEIDIAAVDPDSNNLILGACKFWQEPVGVNVFHNLKDKTSCVEWKKNNRQVWYVLFSASGFTEDLKQLAQTQDNLLLFDEQT